MTIYWVLLLLLLLLHPFQDNLVSWYQKGKTNLDLLEQDIVSGSGNSWDIRKSAPRHRHNHASTPPLSLQAGCPSRRPTNNVKALNALALNAYTRYCFLKIPPFACYNFNIHQPNFDNFWQIIAVEFWLNTHIQLLISIRRSLLLLYMLLGYYNRNHAFLTSLK